MKDLNLIILKKKTAVDAEKVFVYNPKFAYHELSRTSEEGKRLYSTPDGSKVPSVTTILDKTKPAESKAALEQWRKNVGHAKAQQITTEAANRGTRMHTYLEHYVKNNELKEPGSNPFGWASHAMAQTVIEDGLVNVDEFWGVEIPLYFPKLYAGTTDCVGIHQKDESILDFKQTNKPKRQEWITDYYLQLVAYALAHNEVYGTNIRKGVVLMCVKPPVDEMGRPLERPKYQEFTLESKDFDHWANQWWRRLEQYYLTN
jgi:genome maintenance exonuclease 1